MALQPLPPIPNTRLVDDPARDAIWRRYLEQLFNRIIPLVNVHNDLTGLQGGTTNEYYHLTQAQHSTVTSFGTFTNNRVLITGPTSSITTNDALQYLITSSTLTATNISSVTILSSSTATLPLVNIDGGNIDSTAIGANTASTGVFTNVSTATLFASGNVALGDASGDSLTINAGTWTLGSNYTATRAVGVASAGVSTPIQNTLSFSGNSAGTTDLRANRYDLQISGADPISAARALFNTIQSAATSTISLAIASQNTVANNSTGVITAAQIVSATLSVQGNGNITVGTGFTFSTNFGAGTGRIPTINGYEFNNPATSRIDNIRAFFCPDLTLATTLMRAFQGSVSAGTGKANLYMEGTADNILAGNLRVGSTVAPTVALDVTGSQILSGGIAIATRSVVSSYAAVVGDFTILANASGTAFTVTLPHASTFPNKIYTVKKIDSSGNAVTVSSVSNIDGATTTSLAAQFNKIMIQSNTTQWYEI